MEGELNFGQALLGEWKMLNKAAYIGESAERKLNQERQEKEMTGPKTDGSQGRGRRSPGLRP